MTKILLIEDDELNQDILSRRLALRNVEVIVASNGEDGLKIAFENPPDAVVTDVFLPEMDGLEVCSRLRANPITRDLPVVTISAHATAEARQSCLRSGADAYLSKPVNIDHLLASLEGLLQDPAGYRAGHRPLEPPPSAEAKEAFSPSTLLTFASRGKRSVQQYVSLYLDKMHRDLAGLETAVRSRDAERVSYLAHSCLGSSLACGANRLGELFGELETAADEGRLENAIAQLLGIKGEFAVVTKKLQELADQPQ